MASKPQRKTKAKAKKSKTSQPKPSLTIAKLSSRASGMSGSMYTLSQVSQAMVRLRGHEVLGPITTALGAGNGSSISAPGGAGLGSGPALGGIFDLNPASWTRSRASLMASAYEKYRYNRFTVKYRSMMPTTANGGVVISVEFDPEERIVSNDPNAVQQAANNLVFASSSVWQDCAASWVRPSEDKEWYFASADIQDRSNSQGVVYALQTNSVATTSTQLGWLEIDYDIDLYGPELEITSPPGANILTTTKTDIQSNGLAALTTTTSVVRDPNTVYEVRPAVDWGYTFNIGSAGSNNTIPASSGTLLYTAYDSGTGLWRLYPTLTSAIAGSLTQCLYALTATAAANYFAAYVRGLGKSVSM